jgi:CRP-like cAMP-binding protein
MTSSSSVITKTTVVASSFFNGMSKSRQALILAAATPRYAPANFAITNQDDPANNLFLLTKGYARYFYITSRGEKLLLFWLKPGDIFGGAALLLHKSRYLVGTEMVREGELMVWRRETIRRLATRYPRLLDNALSIASTYLTWYLALHLGLAFSSAQQRLAYVLKSLADGFGQKCSTGTYVEITNEQLASAAHVTLFTASRIISVWGRMGLLTKGRGTITLHSSFESSAIR